MRLTKKIALPGLIFICTGLAAFIQATVHVHPQKYSEYGMYRLMANTLLDTVNYWLLIYLAALVLLLFVNGSIFCLHNVFTLNVQNKKKARLVCSVGLCIFTVLVCWGFDHFFLSQQTVCIRWRTTWCIALACAIVVPGTVLIWRNVRPAIPSAMHSPIIVIGALYAFFVAALNGGLFIDRNISAADKPNIIVIVIDCLKARDLGYGGASALVSPTIDSLAKGGVVFNQAYANAPWTKPSVASLFTSLYPNSHLTVDYEAALPDRFLTLAEFLKNYTYHTAMFNGGNENCHTAFNFHQGYDYVTYEPTQNATLLTDAFLSQMEKSNRRPFFAYIHYMDAHLPFNHNEFSDAFIGGNNFFVDPSTKLGGWLSVLNCNLLRMLTSANRLSAEDKRFLKDSRDSQIRFIDKNIQRIMSFLESSRLFDNTIIIVTADHGEELWEHGNFEHGHTLYNELLHVPLILAGGQFSHKEIREPVQLIDVLPTILDFTKINIPARYALQGMSHYKTITSDTSVPGVSVFATSTLYGDEKFCLIKNNKKVIYNTGRTNNKVELFGLSCTERFEYYNLLHDPLEKNPLPEDAAEEFSVLKNELLKFAASESDGTKQKAVVDSSLQQKLESLGYIQ